MRKITKAVGCILMMTLTRTSQASVKTFEKNVSIALVQVDHRYNLSFNSDLEDIDSGVEYRANTSSLSGFELSYKLFTVAYLTSNGFSEEDIAQKGETSYEDLRGGFFLGDDYQWVLLGYYNRYKGLYIQNTPEIDPLAALYIKRTDIEAFNTGGALMYIFSPKTFSAAAAYVQTAQQTESGGSFLGLFSFDGNKFSGESDLIPDSIESNFGPERNLKKGEFATASLSLGYSYTFVLSNFFINGTILFGRGQQTKKYTYDSTETSRTGYANKFNFGYSAGYNGKSFYAGVSYVLNETQYTAGTVKVEPKLESSRIFIGFRL